MNAIAPRRADRQGPKGTEATPRTDPLFGHLFASRAAHERPVFPWFIAALVQLPVAYLFFSSSLGERAVRQAGLIIRPIFTDDDTPTMVYGPARAAPVPQQSIAGDANPEHRARGVGVGTPALTAPGAIPVGIPAAPADHDRAQISGFAEIRKLGPASVSARAAAAAAARARMVERLAPYNDSIAAEQRGIERGMTVESREGKRWGMSPGKLHLGEVTFKLSVATNGGQVPDVIVPPAGRRAEISARVIQWHEIELQSRRAQTRNIFDNRVKEIRNLQDRQRRKASAPGR